MTVSVFVKHCVVKTPIYASWRCSEISISPSYRKAPSYRNLDLSSGAWTAYTDECACQVHLSCPFRRGNRVIEEVGRYTFDVNVIIPVE